jgi:hypothetical protein
MCFLSILTLGLIILLAIKARAITDQQVASSAQAALAVPSIWFFPVRPIKSRCAWAARQYRQWLRDLCAELDSCVIIRRFEVLF